MSKLRSCLAAAASIIAATIVLSAATAQADKCTSLRLKAIAKKEAGLLTCESKVAQKGDPSLLTACRDKVLTKFSTSFAKSGTCQGLQADSESIADDCRDKVRAALPDGTATASKCEAKRLKAAGKKAEKKLLCYSKAAKKGVAVDSAAGGCLDKASAQFVKSFESVSGCTGDDGQTASVETIVDTECVAQQVAPLAVCGNMNVDDGEQCDPPGSSCGGTAVCGNDCTCLCTVDTCPCDFLDPSVCLYPFPNDFFTVADPDTDTGRRVSFPLVAMPKNASHVSMDPTPYAGNDGFSPGSTILTRVPGVDLAQTGAPPITDLARSLEPGAPIVIVNSNTLERHLLFAELDANAPNEADRTLIIHPAVNLAEGTRYIVALRNMKDSSGALLKPNPDFVAYRDGKPTGDPAKEARRAHMNDLFSTLVAASVPKADLYLAWDFTVASERNLSERLLFMRDDAFQRLSSAAPAFVVSTVEDNVDSKIFRRVTGTFQVERYVNSTMAPATLVLDSNGLPVHQATTQPASFICNIPRSALGSAAGPAVPARASIYGHGLLGSNTEVNAGNVESMGNEHNFVFCATKWIGMADEDIANAVGILQELGKFPSLTDRLQQAMINQLFLARLMINPHGFVSDPAFQDASGNPVIDTSDVFYDGNSQGGIFGGTVMAIAQDITRGVLGVPGMNYSLLLTRSTDFATYSAILYPAYPVVIQRPLLFALIQMLWDRSDPNGLAHHMTTDPLPNTPPHTVLLHEAFGDHQVANVATEIEARTIGASIHQPAIAAGRSYEVTPYFGIPAIPSYPFDGSALVVWDSGAATPPITNTAPNTGNDPHSDPRNSVAGRNQKSAFLQTGGTVIDVCSGAPCVAP
ncbi:MAG TPA: hypothetical protein VJ829_02045 [Candidatus Binatia bacterium]|nr:hypothetical protein [Candidatus Binatia bacterium]